MAGKPAIHPERPIAKHVIDDGSVLGVIVPCAPSAPKKNSITADEIAARQIHVLRHYQRRHEQLIKLHEVKQMFEAMSET